MPTKKGNGGHGQENYDPNTGKYVEDGVPNEYYDNPDEEVDIDLEVENMIFDFEGSEEDELDSLIFGEDDLSLEDDLDNLFEELSREGLLISDEINELTFEESVSTLENLEMFDKSKTRGLSEEEIKNILQAVKIVENNEVDEELKKYNEETFVNLWAYSVKPSDYPSKKDSIEAKKNYFLNEYKGPDKEEKLELLNKFVQAGEIYLTQSLRLGSKYEKAKAILEKYIDPNYAYSSKRKDNAYWFKSYYEAKKLFEPTTKEAIKKMGGMYSLPFKMVEYYTGSYNSFNEPLRKMKYSGGHMSSYGFVKQVEAMTQAIDSSVSNYDVWLQRGTSRITDTNMGIDISWSTTQEELNELVGKTYVDHGFVSCGSNKGAGFDRPIIINTYCPAGTKMLYVNPFSHYSGPKENETIIQRGYSYKIRKAEKAGGRIYLDVDVILNSDVQKYNTQQLQQIEQQYVY